MTRKKLDKLTKEELIQKIKKLKRRKNPRRGKTDKIINELGQLLLRFISSIKTSQTISIILLVFTFCILLLAIWQFSIVKKYQDRTQKEMSRRAKLSLVIEKIDTLEIKNILKIHCALINTGDANAKDVQIRFKLIESDIKIGEPPCLEIDGPFTTTFYDNGSKVIKLAVWKYSEIIYFRKGKNRKHKLKLPWIWVIKNPPITAEGLIFRYNVDSNFGSSIDSLVIKNPFFKNKGKIN